MKNKLSKRLELERNELIKLGWENGMNADDLSRILNLSIARVYQIISKLKLEGRI
jgi:Mor family transcriptional regulator